MFFHNNDGDTNNDSLSARSEFERRDTAAPGFKRGDIFSADLTGANEQGKLRLRVALPIASKLQSSWPAPIHCHSPVDELKKMIKANQQVINIEDQISIANRAWIENLMHEITDLLFSDDINIPGSPSSSRAIKVIAEYGGKLTEGFSVLWLLQSAEVALQKYLARLRQNNEERDAHLATLHNLQLYELMAGYLVNEAHHIDAHGLDLENACDAEHAKKLEEHLHSFACDPLWIGWPASIEAETASAVEDFQPGAKLG